MISAKKNQNHLVIKWSCSVCIGICFYVYMVYSFDGMFKLYCVCSLYSMLIFFNVHKRDEMVQKTNCLLF